MQASKDVESSINTSTLDWGVEGDEEFSYYENHIKQVPMLNKGSSHTGHGLSFLPSWTALQLGFPIIPLQSLSSFFLFVVVFVVVCNATRRLPCGVDSISCCNVLCLFPVLSHFEWDLWREQSSMSSEVSFTMLIQFIVLVCVLSAHLCPDQS